MEDEEVKRKCGIEATLYISFLYMCIKFFFYSNSL